MQEAIRSTQRRAMEEERRQVKEVSPSSFSSLTTAIIIGNVEDEDGVKALAPHHHRRCCYPGYSLRPSSPASLEDEGEEEAETLPSLTETMLVASFFSALAAASSSRISASKRS